MEAADILLTIAGPAPESLGGAKRDAMLIGAVLAIVVLLLFLRHVRITAISASAIPLTMAITIFVMSAMGQTFNLMTLGAMAIAIGLVIDDAVVITENVVRHLHLNADRGAAIRAAVQELIWPVTTSTITTVVVFLPLGLLEGVVGQFFKALSLTLTIAVLVSLVLALTIIPLLSEQFITAADAEQSEAAHAAGTGIPARLGRLVDALSVLYERTLGGVLHHARAMVVAGILLVVGGWFAYRAVETGFMPEMDEGAFVIDYFTPGGTALAETDRHLKEVDKILASMPEVTATSRRTGAELGLFATAQNTGDYVVRLAPERRRKRQIGEVIDDVRGHIEQELPRLRVEFVQILSDVINDLAGNAHPVEVKLFGADLAALEAYGTTLDSAMTKIDGLEDLYSGVSEPTAEMAACTSSSTPRAASAPVAGSRITNSSPPSRAAMSLLRTRLPSWREVSSAALRARAIFAVMSDSVRVPMSPTARIHQTSASSSTRRDSRAITAYSSVSVEVVGVESTNTRSISTRSSAITRCRSAMNRSAS